MRITINKLDFDVSAIPGQLRAAVLSDPMMQQGVWRDVWRWDQPTAKGTFLTPVSDRNAITLPNALTFFMPRATSSGVVINNEKLAKKSGQRFLEAVGAKTPLDVLRALTSILPLARCAVPLKSFEPLNGTVSYDLKAHIDFAIVQMREAGRNLNAYLLVPSQIAFHHEITAIGDREGYDALLAEKPELAAIQPGYLLPPGAKATHDVRRIAVARRIEDMKPVIERAQANEGTPDEATRREFARLVQEWRLLTQPAKAPVA